MSKNPNVKIRVLSEDELSKLVREEVTLTTSEEIEEALLSPKEDFWDQLRTMADECDEILSRGGYPKVWQPILTDGSKWREFTGNPRDASGGWQWTRGAF